MHKFMSKQGISRNTTQTLKLMRC